MGRPIHRSVEFFSVLKELTRFNHPLKVSSADEVEATHILSFSRFTSGYRLFLFKQVSILLKYRLQKCLLANSRWSYQNKRLVLKRGRVERVEVLLCVDKDVILI